MVDKVAKEATNSNYIDLAVSFRKTEINSIKQRLTETWQKQWEKEDGFEFKGKVGKIKEGSGEMKQYQCLVD